MCTVSIVPTAAGCRIVCNRDEQRTRPSARSPRAWPAGVAWATYPRDPVSDGTWIGVNDHLLAVALLNRTPDDRVRLQSPCSRGSIVPRLLACPSVAQAVREADELECRAFEPFQLVMVQRSTVALLTSDSTRIAREVFPLVVPLMFTSSSLGDGTVKAPRRRLFERLVLADDDWVRGQFWFHRHQWSRRSDISVFMARDDAATVSRTTLDITPQTFDIDYESLTTDAMTVPTAV